MHVYLSIQSTYDQVEIALFQGTHMRAKVTTHKFNASSELIITINNLLSSHSKSLTDLQFIAINQGPGPFTTLRVTIATVNGIGFATGIPLVGIHGLPAFIAEHHRATTPVTIALLNAFNKDLYYAIADKELPLQVGVENHVTLLRRLLEKFPNTPIQFIGNGVTLYQTEIVDLFKTNAHFPTPFPLFPSIEQIGKIGFAQWQSKTGIESQILPDYLKNYSAIIRYPETTR